MTAAVAARVVLEQASLAPPDAAAGWLSKGRGFLPPSAPLLALPRSHAAWDEVARELPSLYAEARVRQAVRGLPALSAEGDALEAAYVPRASLILGLVAHLFVREAEHVRRPLSGGDAITRAGLREDPALALPASIEEPWRALARRLGRREPCLHFDDLTTSNWRYRDRATSDDVRVENLALLVPTTRSPEERIFYTTMVETMAVCAPLVEGVVRAQEAAAREDAEALAAALHAMLGPLRHATRVTLQKIDPMPLAANHVDPLVWAKFVAPLAAPIRRGEVGLSGGGSVVFHMLDAFFARPRRDTKIGREATTIAAWLPANHARFVSALREVDVGAFVRRRGASALAGAYEQALDAYAGKRGWLGAHRLKVYGFMEIGFRAGRNSTNGGFTGSIAERAWEMLDRDLEDAREERFGKPPAWAKARRAGAAASGPGAPGLPRHHHVVLDTSSTGLRYEAGDRCMVLARQSDALVERTLGALRARDGATIGLSRTWRSHLASLGVGGDAGELPLRTFLAMASLRPLSRGVAKRLASLSQSSELRAVVERRGEDQLELCDALELIAGRYDVRRLWTSPPWEADNLSQIVPPMEPRVYSIASAPGDGARRLELSVGALRYRSEPPEPAAGREQTGAASAYLSLPPDRADDVPIAIVSPLKFSLPDDPSRPIVMFAGGTGIAPFRAFWQARARQPGAGRAVLVLGVRSPDELLYRDELSALVAEGRLELFVAFSRAAGRLVTRRDGGAPRLVPVDARPGHVDALVADALDDDLYRLCVRREQGGEEASVYLCGRTAFARTVFAALEAMHERRGLPGARSVAQLVADGRLMLDIFTTFAPLTAPGVLGGDLYDASEVARHNSPERGQWMIIEGQVYDVTRFLETHPGGDRVLQASAGTDATRSWRQVEHQLHPEVRSMLDLYKIGAVRRLDFKSRWGIALTGSVPQTLSLVDLFKRWVRYLYAIVELENQARIGAGLRQRPAFGREHQGGRLLAHVILEQRASFDETSVDALVGEPLDMLWRSTIGLVDARKRVDALDDAVRLVRASPRAARARAARDALHASLASLDAAPDPARLAEVHASLASLERDAMALLASLKDAVARGVALFERWESEVVARAGHELIAALEQIPALLEAYYGRITD